MLRWTVAENKPLMVGVMQQVAEANPQVLDSVLKSVSPDVADKFRAFMV